MAIKTRAGVFVISSGGGGDTVTGALKHLVGEVMRKSGRAANTEIAEAIAIKELKAITEAAAMNWIVTGKKMIVRTAGAEWEVIFGAARNPGDVARLYHLVPLRFF